MNVRLLTVPLTVTATAYQIHVNSLITIATATPADGGLGPVNRLDPAIELFDPSGALVASDFDSGHDGRNSALSYEAGHNGNYTIRLFGQHKTAGEYILTTAGHSEASTFFSVQSTDPADGALLTSSPRELAVRFDDFVKADTVRASDLTVGNRTGIRTQFEDGDRVVFSLPPLGEGQHTVSLAAGALQDVQGTPVESFASTFTVDTTAPRVMASSIGDSEVFS